MTNVKAAMEYAQTFEREAMREQLDAALGDVNHMSLLELEAMVLHHKQQIKDIAEHLLELRKWGSPMMEFKQEKPTMGMEYAANFEKAEKLLEKKEWVGLTGVEINHIFTQNVGYRDMMKEVENLLKEKNNG